ncbi:MAG: SGNH/GDSL hydrolase family protein [Clostridia bacterium]|nr:SGNH/GDSL hydrolase family protein [Clostridia bacterium]
MKRKKLARISARNIIIVLLAAVVVLSAVEFSLAFSPESVYTAGSDLMIMRLERTPPGYMLTTADMADSFGLGAYAYGYEAPDYPLLDYAATSAPYDEDTVNVAIIGDSFVFGEASLNCNELLWRQAETLLRAEGYNVRFIAVAMEGATAFDELGWLTGGVYEELSPDMVIFGYVENDALTGGIMAQEQTPEGKVPAFISAVGTLFPRLAGKLTDYVDARTIYNNKYGRLASDGDYISVLRGETRENYEENFVKPLDAFSKEHDLPVVVMTLPAQTNSPKLSELFRPLKEIFSDTSVHFYDLYPEYHRRMSGAKHKNSIHVNAENDHPGSASHLFYAEYIARFLKEDFPELLGGSAGIDLNSPLLAVNDHMPDAIGLEAVSVGESVSRYLFEYPDLSSPHDFVGIEILRYCLSDPMGKSCVKLLLENPAELEKVELDGSFSNAELYYTRIAPKLGYDNYEIFPAAKITDGVWEIPVGEQVASLCVHLESKSAGDRSVSLTITRREEKG